MARAVAIIPMTLANMRANGIRSLIVYCSACPRTVVFNVDAYPEARPVPDVGSPWCALAAA
jgi:hypothetical protein